MAAESEIEAIWNTVQEFVHALERRDPTVRRWMVPGGEADLLLDLYGEQALLTLLKSYLDRERFILLRSGTVPEEKALRWVEIGWVQGEGGRPAADERVTLQLRRVRRRWQVEDIWPSPLDMLLTVSRARELAEQEERVDPAVLFLAGLSTVSLEGCGELDDVETLFVLGMYQEGFSPREIVRAVRLWRDFIRLGRPAYRKPALYAATIHYAFSRLGHYGDTRRSIAAYYGVNDRGLGIRFAQIEQCLHLTHFDPRYSAFAPPEGWKERWEASGRPWPIPLGQALDVGL
ncbi:MAG: hypothetical protein ACP5OO_10165 [Chloroflexia bacterium]